MEYTRTDTKQQSRVIDTRQQSKQTPSIFELLQGNNSRTLQQGPVTQRMLYGDPQNAKELIEKQIELQKRGPTVDAPAPSEGLPGVEASVPEDDGVEAEVTPGQIHDRLDNDFEGDSIKRPHNQDYFTTVGFEFEFAQFPNNGKDSILENVLHTQLARSAEVFEYTGLPFFLETDAGSELELVTPPFVIETVGDTSIPLADDVEKADDLMETGITEVIGDKHEKAEDETAIELLAMAQKIGDNMGLHFNFSSDPRLPEDEVGRITNHNLLGCPSAKLKEKIDASKGAEYITLGVTDISEENALKVIPSHKLDRLSSTVPIGKNGIGTQVNIAMDMEGFQQMANLPKPYQSYDLEVSEAKRFIEEEIKRGCGKYCPILGDKFSFLAGEIAMHLVNTFALQGMDDYLATSKKFWQGEETEYRPQHPESSVKDLRGVWFKDSVRGLIDDVLNNRIPDYNFRKMELAGVLRSMTFGGFGKNIGRGWELDPEKMMEAANMLAGYLEGGKEEESGGKPGVCERDKKYQSDVRPDTYVHLDPGKMAPGLEGRKMHLVESRYFSSKEVICNLRCMTCLHFIKMAENSSEDIASEAFGNVYSSIDELVKSVNGFDGILSFNKDEVLLSVSGMQKTCDWLDDEIQKMGRIEDRRVKQISSDLRGIRTNISKAKYILESVIGTALMISEISRDVSKMKKSDSIEVMSAYVHPDCVDKTSSAEVALYLAKLIVHEAENVVSEVNKIYSGMYAINSSMCRIKFYVDYIKKIISKTKK